MVLLHLAGVFVVLFFTGSFPRNLVKWWCNWLSYAARAGSGCEPLQL